MPQAEALQLTEAELKTAAQNYYACLNLEPDSNVLIVTDQPLIPTFTNANMQVRYAMTSNINDRLLQDGHERSTIRFSSKSTREEMKNLTRRALSELDERPDNEGESDDKPVTVVYLGDAWANRPGIYDAVKEFGKDKKVRFAGSLGFSTGDARVMSQIGPEQLASIKKTNEYFDAFFKDHPDGTFTITTRGEDGIAHSLSLDYDTTQAPFETDMGQTGEGYGVDKENFKYSNIPGGEQFAAPFPFRNTNGSFAAEGLTFSISNGIVADIILPDDFDMTKLAQNQLDLIRFVKEGKQIPVSEIGLGFYALAGIKTYTDSSTLSLEKGGPHIGFGTDPTDKSPERAQMEELSGEFHHGDMVLDNAEITHRNPRTLEETHFYPPAE